MNNIDNVRTGVFEYQGKNYNFNFFTDIDISKKVSFVNGVTNTIVTEEHYQPLLRGMIFGFQLINVFSDALSNFQDESGEDKKFSYVEIEDIVNNTKIVDIIIENAKEGLIDELNEAISKDIEYKTGIHTNPIGEAVASLVKTLEDRVKEIDVESLMSFAKVFKDLPTENMTPEGIVDAYGKSDVFKQLKAEADEKNAKTVEEVSKVININSTDSSAEKTTKAKKTTKKKTTTAKKATTTKKTTKKSTAKKDKAEDKTE